jgi:hypothetical protein
VYIYFAYGTVVVRQQLFSTDDIKEYTLSYPASYKEQTDILSRNLILNLEGNLPFFKLLKDPK